MIDSVYSDNLEKAASALPQAPTTIRKNSERSSKSSVYLEWDKVADQDVPTLGYVLLMSSDTKGSSEFVPIFNGMFRPEVTEYEVKGLITGSVYAFKLKAVNFNGESDLSDVLYFNACVAPSGVMPPERIDSTTSSITIGWAEPVENGGCPITGYAVFRDEGDQTDPQVEVNLDDDPGVRNIPTLRQLEVTNLPSGKEGEYIRFKLRAFNREGWTDSGTVSSILMSAVPSSPSWPSTIVEFGNSTYLKFNIGELSGSDAGNDVVQAYGVEIDDGRAGNFSLIEAPSMATQYEV